MIEANSNEDGDSIFQEPDCHFTKTVSNYEIMVITAKRMRIKMYKL